MTTPYVPLIPQMGPQRALYRSIVQVTRVIPVFLDTGAITMSWQPITDIVDVYLAKPGMLSCRIDLQFTRPGKDAVMPQVAGRVPDRFGVIYYDPVTNPETGVPLVLAGDRLVCVGGPIFGTFDLRQVPEVAQDFTGAHHVEAQVVETSLALQPGSPTPFPGVQP